MGENYHLSGLIDQDFKLQKCLLPTYFKVSPPNNSEYFDFPSQNHLQQDLSFTGSEVPSQEPVLCPFYSGLYLPDLLCWGPVLVGTILYRECHQAEGGTEHEHGHWC